MSEQKPITEPSPEKEAADQHAAMDPKPTTEEKEQPHLITEELPAGHVLNE